jgi:Family of unknown function (DUF6498)
MIVLVGGFLIVGLGLPSLLLILIALKTVADVTMHLRSHRKLTLT